VRLYRVLFYDESAAQTERGGVLYIPPQGANRVDNPDHYSVRYLGDSPAGVCAEVFYRAPHLQIWNSAMLRPLATGDRRVLAWYDIADHALICDLDDPTELVKRSLRPSQIITRNYRVTQSWALAIFREKAWAGASWWSYCDARWRSIGLWNHDIIVDYGIEELTLDHPAMQDAAAVLNIKIEGH